MTGGQERPRWRTLSAEQRAVAAELHRRAAALRDGSEDLGWSEAVELAAVQFGMANQQREDQA